MQLNDMYLAHRIHSETKGQLVSKANCRAMNSSKKRTNEFIYISMRRVFVRFLEQIEDSKKAFRNYLTFNFHKFSAQKQVTNPSSESNFGTLLLY